MSGEAWVYVDVRGTPRSAGRLWSHVRRGRESATFAYAPSWLADSERFSIDPALTLDRGRHQTPAGRALFGAFEDSAPDRWGRVLMRRAERRAAAAENRTQRSLTELDYLLRVHDEARQGALRFSATAGGPFLAAGSRDAIPPLVKLPELLHASRRVVEDDETDEQLRLLLAPGSSLGGARPKASVRESDGRLSIAKFPHRNDDFNAVRWESVALRLADYAGIRVPAWRVEAVGKDDVLVLQRFDRRGRERVPFLSAMTMLGAADHETRSYLEIVDAIRVHGTRPRADMKELWRRLVFSVLISNTDDHLRNHGFIYEGADGWGLSPAYDLNPVPLDVKPRVLSTCIDLDDGTASLELALDVSEYFELSRDEAWSVAREVGAAASRWRQVAEGLGLSHREAERMKSAFEHADLAAAS